jgi:mRNA-decapping enzyme subunit 2
MATYHDLAPPSANQVTAKGRIWSYPSPTPTFKPIKDYLCFYAASNTDAAKVGRWICVSNPQCE